MTPKEKAQQLIDLLGNKLKALSAANEAINDYKSTSMFYCSKVKILPKIFWQEVKQEIEAL
jgi:hypothetical protein